MIINNIWGFIFTSAKAPTIAATKDIGKRLFTYFICICFLNIYTRTIPLRKKKNDANPIAICGVVKIAKKGVTVAEPEIGITIFIIEVNPNTIYINKFSNIF